MPPARPAAVAAPVAPPSPVELVAWAVAQPQALTILGAEALVGVAQAGAFAAWNAATRVLRSANPMPKKDGDTTPPLELGRAITEASRSAYHAAEAGLAAVEAAILLRDARADAAVAAAALEVAAGSGDAQAALEATRRARETRAGIGPAAQRAVLAAVQAGATQPELAGVLVALATYPGGMAAIER